MSTGTASCATVTAQPSAPAGRLKSRGTDNQVRVLDTIPYIEEDANREPTHYLIGQGAKVSWPVKITAITPEADNKIIIAGCIESEFVHSVDQGVLPPPPPEVKPPPPGLVIHNLLATQGGTVHAPVIFLSWDIAVGADRYLIEYSTDGRQTWQPAGTGQSFINQHEFAAEVGLLTCRVAAVGAIRGEWADIVVNAGGDFDTPSQVQPELVEPFTGDALKVRWDPQPAAARYVVRVISHGTGVRSLYLERNINQYSYHYTDAQQDAAGRTITVTVAAENGNGVLGAYGELTATNPPPAVPDNVEVTGLLNTIMVQCRHPDDTDLRELRVYGEQQTGFTPSPANLLATSQNALLSVTVPTNTTWWVCLAWVDQWGATDLNYSGEFAAEASQILETVIGPDSIETPMLKANAVAAGKVAADAITGREISAATTIIAGTGENTAGMNGAIISDNPTLSNIRFWSGAEYNIANTASFQVDKEGSLTAYDGRFVGDISGSSGQFSGTVTTAAITSGSITGTTISGGIIIGADIYAGAVSIPVVPALNYPAGIGGTPSTLIIPVSAYPDVTTVIPASNMHIYSGRWSEMHYIPIAANNNNQDLTGARFRYSNAPRHWYKSEFKFYDTGGNHGDRVVFSVRLYRGSTLLSSGSFDVFHNSGRPTSGSVNVAGEGVIFNVAGAGANNQNYFSVNVTTPDLTNGHHISGLRGINKETAYRLEFSCGRRAYKASNVQQLITLNNSTVPVYY